MWIHWPFFPKTWTKGHWPLDDLWPHVCWGHMCDSTQGSLCPSPKTIHQCMWIQWSILQNTTYIHIPYILHTYTYYIQNEWSHSLLLNSVQARQKTSMFPAVRAHCILTTKFAHSFFLMMCVFTNKVQKNMAQNDFWPEHAENTSSVCLLNQLFESVSGLFAKGISKRIWPLPITLFLCVYLPVLLIKRLRIAVFLLIKLIKKCTQHQGWHSCASTRIDPLLFLWTHKFQLKLTITRPLGRACIHNGVNISHGKSLAMSHFCLPNYQELHALN